MLVPNFVGDFVSGGSAMQSTEASKWSPNREYYLPKLYKLPILCISASRLKSFDSVHYNLVRKV